MNRHKFVVHVGRDGTRYENVCGHVIGPDQICRHLPQNQIHLSDDVADVIEECQRRADAVVDAAIAWRESGRLGSSVADQFDAGERLTVAIDHLLELRDTEHRCPDCGHAQRVINDQRFCVDGPALVVSCDCKCVSASPAANRERGLLADRNRAYSEAAEWRTKRWGEWR